MVAKWQKAKQEMQEEEERLIMEREQELDQENDTRLRIEKWKMEQLQRLEHVVVFVTFKAQFSNTYTLTSTFGPKHCFFISKQLWSTT